MIYIKRMLSELFALFGVESNSTSHIEKWISSIGALIGILTVYWASQWYLDTAGIMLMVASMGASAVLLFAVPHGALSQPWPVLGGNLISAFVGVTCQQLYPDHLLTPALAVGLAVACMHYFRCMHPPGGATALSAVIGGPEIAAMGYSYLITPILVNVLSILTIAILFNALFPWRRYPAHWVRRRQAAPATPQPSVPVALTQEDFTAAMQKLDSYIDITAEDLVELVELASEHARQAWNTASTTVTVKPAHGGSAARSPNYEKFQDAPTCWCRTEHLKVVAVPMSGFALGKNSSFGREMRSSTIRVNGCAFRLPKETAIPNYLLRWLKPAKF